MNNEFSYVKYASGTGKFGSNIWQKELIMTHWLRSMGKE
jgi:hypothetical protein